MGQIDLGSRSECVDFVLFGSGRYEDVDVVLMPRIGNFASVGYTEYQKVTGFSGRIVGNSPLFGCRVVGCAR